MLYKKRPRLKKSKNNGKPFVRITEISYLNLVKKYQKQIKIVKKFWWNNSFFQEIDASLTSQVSQLNSTEEFLTRINNEIS